MPHSSPSRIASHWSPSAMVSACQAAPAVGHVGRRNRKFNTEPRPMKRASGLLSDTTASHTPHSSVFASWMRCVTASLMVCGYSWLLSDNIKSSLGAAGARAQPIGFRVANYRGLRSILTSSNVAELRRRRIAAECVLDSSTTSVRTDSTAFERR